MATRSIPKLDIFECLPSATEIAQRRVVGRDLDFIQNMIERADALTIQAQNATDYMQLSKVIDNFAKLASRAEEKSQKLKEFADESNPLTDVNNTSELIEKVRLLSQAIEPQISNLKSQFESSVKTQLEELNSSIDYLTSGVNSASSAGDVIALFEPIQETSKEIIKNAKVLNSDPNSGALIEKLNDLSSLYQDKAEIYSDAYISDAVGQMGSIQQQISQLINNVDSLNSAEAVSSHLTKLEELSRTIASAAGELNTSSGSENIVININELSILTHSKIANMIDGAKILKKLEPLKEKPDELVRAVKEASLRYEVEVVEEQLMPLLNNYNDLIAKVN